MMGSRVHPTQQRRAQVSYGPRCAQHAEEQNSFEMAYVIPEAMEDLFNVGYAGTVVIASLRWTPREDAD
ncbi:MAG TPA: hypothetical protein VK487_03765 [Candidatus Bathyarchaeia archaeon]|nr:hypothetical protein [Candidatus Bathyarchaeia archaeon]